MRSNEFPFVWNKIALVVHQVALDFLVSDLVKSWVRAPNSCFFFKAIRVNKSFLLTRQKTYRQSRFRKIRNYWENRQRLYKLTFFLLFHHFVVDAGLDGNHPWGLALSVCIPGFLGKPLEIVRLHHSLLLEYRAEPESYFNVCAGFVGKSHLAGGCVLDKRSAIV